MISKGRLVLVGLAALAAPVGASAQGSGVSPGQWEIAVTVNSMESPSMPPGIAKMMVGKTTRIKHCITPEEAARGPQEMMKSDKSCVFTKYSMSGGKLNSEMTCKQGGGTMTVVSTGQFTPDGFTSTGRSVTTGQMSMTMTSSSVGRLLGPCSK